MTVFTRLLVVLVLIAGLAVLPGCTDSGDSGDTESSEAAYEAGSAEAGGWKVTLDSVESYDSPEREPADTANVFLATDITFENMTSDEMWWDTAKILAMRDGDGVTYPADGTIVPNDIEVVMGSSQPADPRGGLVAFEVPGDATDLVLVFTPEELGEDETVAEWVIGDASAY